MGMEKGPEGCGSDVCGNRVLATVSVKAAHSEDKLLILDRCWDWGQICRFPSNHRAWRGPIGQLFVQIILKCALLDNYFTALYWATEISTNQPTNEGKQTRRPHKPDGATLLTNKAAMIKSNGNVTRALTLHASQWASSRSSKHHTATLQYINLVYRSTPPATGCCYTTPLPSLWMWSKNRAHSITHTRKWLTP